MVVFEGGGDAIFSASIVDQAPVELSLIESVIYKIFDNLYGFTHALAVPSNFHSVLKDKFESRRNKLFLCIPIFRFEFSGEESELEFKEIAQRLVPVFKWTRTVPPKIRVYFDNPGVGTGTHESGVLFKFNTLISEVESLNGVVSGFIEITNYKGEVIEVLSPADEIYTFIRNRVSHEEVDFSSLVQKLEIFVKT